MYKVPVCTYSCWHQIPPNLEPTHHKPETLNVSKHSELKRKKKAPCGFALLHGPAPACKGATALLRQRGSTSGASSKQKRVCSLGMEHKGLGPKFRVRMFLSPCCISSSIVRLVAWGWGFVECWPEHLLDIVGPVNYLE